MTERGLLQNSIEADQSPSIDSVVAHIQMMNDAQLAKLLQVIANHIYPIAAEKAHNN